MALATEVINAYAKRLHTAPLREQMLSIHRMASYSKNPEALQKALCDRLMVLHYYGRITQAGSGAARYKVMQEMLTTIDQEIVEVVLEGLIKGL